MEHPLPTTFGPLLKHYRLSRCLTQGALAEQAELSTNEISNLERGVRGQPYPDTLARLFEALKLTPEEQATLGAAARAQTIPGPASGLSLPSEPDMAPQEERVQAAGIDPALPLWMVPYQRNPYFTGRNDLLERLDLHLAAHPPAGESCRVALTQPQAIKGLGGIGKTQIAVEYAYRARDLGRYTHTLWVNATSEETIIASFVTIAALIHSGAPQHETDQREIVKAAKRWLEQCRHRWLVIFDNADEVTLVRDYLPQSGNGSIVLTTRAHAVGSLAISLEVETMGFLEGTHLLLRRAQRLERASDEEINQAGNIVVALDHFPLALDQAGAYLEETQCSLMDYLDLYRTQHHALLARRGALSTDYPHSVATTWLLSFQQVQQANPAAAELLHLSAFLAPDRIPEELIKEGAAHWPAVLQKVAADPLAFQQMIADLLKFSLVKRLVEEKSLSIHRLVQVVQKDQMDPETQRAWAERVVRAINVVFPDDPQDLAVWPQCLRYLEQAQACSALIEHYGLSFAEAADLLHRAGCYCYTHAFYAIAEPLWRRALSMREHQEGPDHPDIAASLNNLASLYWEQGQYQQALPLFQRALAIREQAMGSDHPQVAQSLNDLALLYQDRGQDQLALPLHQRALAIREQALGPEHPDLAESLNNLALLFRYQGQYQQALPLFQRARAILERTLGPDHPQVATCLNNLANLYRDQGRYDEALPLCQQALAFWERTLGPNHPAVSVSLNILANLYRAQGQYVQAEPLSQRALAIREQAYGPEHPRVATSLNTLADLYRAQGQYQQAEPLYQRALAIREQALGHDHPDVASSLNNLAELYCAQGQYDKALPLFQRALAIGEQALPDHPHTATCLENLAALQRKLGHDDQAAELDARAQAIHAKQTGSP